jgi:SAM-dependent methyltransferase
MVEAVAARAKALGLTNVSARVLDAQELDLPDGELFDRALCRFGFMLMSNPIQALRESGRVLAPDGQLTLAVWGSAEENPWLALILNAVVAHFNAPPPEPGTPGPFTLGDETRLRQLLEEAGFKEVSIARLDIEQTYDSLEAWWEEVIAAGGPLATALRALPAPDVEAIREAATGAAQSYVVERGAVAFPATVLGATAGAFT